MGSKVKMRSSALAVNVQLLGLLFVLATLVAVAGAGAIASEARPTSLAFDCQTIKAAGKDGFGIVAGDWTQDGRVDLAVTYLTPPLLAAFPNMGARQFGRPATVSVGSVPRNIGVGDIDGDGIIDLVTANGNTNDVTVLLGDGKAAFRRVADLHSGVGPFDAELADLDADGHLDLVVANESNDPFSVKGTVSLFYGRGSGKEDDLFEKKTRLQAGDHPSAVEVADLDGKEGPDLVVANWESGDLLVFLSQGKRQFAEAQQVMSGIGLPYSLVSEDFDGDGAMDLAVTAVRGHSVFVLHGDGKGNFPRRRQHEVGRGVRSVAAGDVNGDGALDLVTANVNDGTLSVLLQQRNGGFSPATTISVGKWPRTVVVHDLNADGLTDVAVVHGKSGAIFVLWQTAGEARPCPKGEGEE